MNRIVEEATPADVRPLARLVTDAFLYLPASVWLVPDLVYRPRVLGAYFTHLVEDTLTHGVVHTTSDRTGVALWIPHGAGATPAPQIDDLVSVVGEEYTRRFHAFETRLHQRHPTVRAHHHLAVLAVAPQHQGRGVGTMLLTAHHQYLDGEGNSAYLEAAHVDLPRYYDGSGTSPTEPASGCPATPTPRRGPCGANPCGANPGDAGRGPRIPYRRGHGGESRGW